MARLTEEEYLELDRANDFRSEFIAGEMLAMSWAPVAIQPCPSI